MDGRDIAQQSIPQEYGYYQAPPNMQQGPPQYAPQQGGMEAQYAPQYENTPQYAPQYENTPQYAPPQGTPAQAPTGPIQWQTAMEQGPNSFTFQGCYTHMGGESYTYDPNFHGVDEDRHCTDIFMCTVFFLFLCGMVALFVIALGKSRIEYLYIPTDYRGLLCGYNNLDLPLTNTTGLLDLTGKDYLFWTRPGKSGFVRSFCVSSCPDAGQFTDVFTQYVSDSPKTVNDSCSSGTVAYVEDYYSTDAARYYCPYKTFLLLRRCIPHLDAFANITEFTQAFSDMSGTLGSLTVAMYDLVNSWWTILVAVGIALVLSLIWLLCLRFTASFFVWFTVLLCLGASGFLTYMSYQQAHNAFDNTSNVEAYTFGYFSADTNETTFTVIFWILVVFDVVLVLLVLFLFSRIKLSIKIIELVSRVFGEVPTLFFFPILLLIIMLVWWAYIVGVSIVLFGAGDFTRKDVDGIDKVVMTYDSTIQGFSIYHFVGFLWGTAFISALGEMTVAGVFADFYFSVEPRRANMHSSPVASSMWRAIRYHMGSLAFGSLIITIIRIIRAIIEYFDQKTKDTQNDFVKYILKCTKCCCWCLEKFLQYINRNTYVLIAIHGYSFFEGCVRAFQLIFRNAARVFTINWAGDFTLFLGRILVSSLVSGGALYYFWNQEDISYPIFPTAFILIMSYIASNAFTSLFEMGIDSMFMCFMEDEERHSGAPNQPKYAPQGLSDFVSQTH